jgi:hypothetical protein
MNQSFEKAEKLPVTRAILQYILICSDLRFGKLYVTKSDFSSGIGGLYGVIVFCFLAFVKS